MLLLLVLAFPLPSFTSPADPPPSRGMLWDGVRADDELCKLCERNGKGTHDLEDRYTLKNLAAAHAQC